MSSVDPDWIRRQWTAHPDANIGIACKPSGIAVLDPDAPKERKDRTGKVIVSADGEVAVTADGRPAWLALAREHGWPETADVTTPRSGWHIYFRDPFELRNSAGTLAPGIDVRAGGGQHGGYVVAPGSVIDGRTYRGTLPPVRDLPLVPASLAAALASKARGMPREPARWVPGAVAVHRSPRRYSVRPRREVGTTG